eukprot:6213717-Pleurochrysis_carterae.AAC.1
MKSSFEVRINAFLRHLWHICSLSLLIDVEAGSLFLECLIESLYIKVLSESLGTVGYTLMFGLFASYEEWHPVSCSGSNTPLTSAAATCLLTRHHHGLGILQSVYVESVLRDDVTAVISER